MGAGTGSDAKEREPEKVVEPPEASTGRRNVRAVDAVDR